MLKLLRERRRKLAESLLEDELESNNKDLIRK